MIDKKFLTILRILKKLSAGDLTYFIDHLNDGCVNDICECVFNVLNTDLKMSKAKREKLKAHIKKNCSITNIKKISNAKLPISKRRQALKMEGRGLPLILASVVPFLIDLFTRKKHK